MVRYRLRLSAKRTSYIHRHNSISAKEKRFLSNLKRHLLILLALYKKSKKLSSIESLRVSKIKKCLTMVLLKYHQVAYTPFEKHIRMKRSNINFRSRDIDSFSSSECWKLFRTRKEHLYQLKIAFKFVDRDFTADNNIIFKGEEILLIGLARYSTAARKNLSRIVFFVLLRILKKFQLVQINCARIDPKSHMNCLYVFLLQKQSAPMPCVTQSQNSLASPYIYIQHYHQNSQRIQYIHELLAHHNLGFSNFTFLTKTRQQITLNL
jgi:hypothetical protein